MAEFAYVDRFILFRTPFVYRSIQFVCLGRSNQERTQVASANQSKQGIPEIGLDSRILNYENVVKEMQTVIDRATRRR